MLEQISEMMAELGSYKGRTVVIKIGGNSIAEDRNFLTHVARQIVFLQSNGVRIILVHGGGPQIDQALDARKIKSIKGKDGRRITSPRAMRVVTQVMKRMNLEVADAVIGAGWRKDKLVLSARLSKPLVDAESLDPSDAQNNRSGKPINVRPLLIERALMENKIVILHSLGLGPDGAMLYNINGDDYAMAIASAIKAKRLILVTNVPGVLDSTKTRIPSIDENAAQSLIEEGVITGGMVPKVESALSVIRQGVEGVAIIDGGHPWAILGELITYQGLGTLFVPGVTES